MLKSRVRKLEMQQIKDAMKSQGDDIYSQDVIIIKSFKDFIQVYDDEPQFIKPTARILWTKQMRDFVDHYYDDIVEDTVIHNPEPEKQNSDDEASNPPLAGHPLGQGGLGGSYENKDRGSCGSFD